LPYGFNFNPGEPKHNSKKCKKNGARFYITFTLKSGRCDIIFEKGIRGKLNRLSNSSGKSDHPPLDPLPSREGKLFIGLPLK
jgi:hypothetical protein